MGKLFAVHAACTRGIQRDPSRAKGWQSCLLPCQSAEASMWKIANNQLAPQCVAAARPNPSRQGSASPMVERNQGIRNGNFNAWTVAPTHTHTPPNTSIARPTNQGVPHMRTTSAVPPHPRHINLAPVRVPHGSTSTGRENVMLASNGIVTAERRNDRMGTKA